MTTIQRIPAPEGTTSTLIFLHGLGDSGNGWLHLAQYLHERPQFQHVEIILPSAPAKPLTVAGGNVMPQWFDIPQPRTLAALSGAPFKEDDTGYWGTVDWVRGLVAQEESKLGKGHVIVGGFSQGAAVSLGVAASGTEVPVISLSGFAIKTGLNERLEKLSPKAKAVPIFHGHGDNDKVIDIKFARDTQEVFQGAGFTNYELKEYPYMGHTCSPQELDLVAQFIAENLSKHLDSVI
ncbi:palmitoyl-(protein) hydrolase [Martiniozyma asiatica (nom. inval.)]|nr:palmitoyl-(protein) hydrolase [Martiniozyma asiatica]